MAEIENVGTEIEEDLCGLALAGVGEGETPALQREPPRGAAGVEEAGDGAREGVLAGPFGGAVWKADVEAGSDFYDAGRGGVDGVFPDRVLGFLREFFEDCETLSLYYFCFGGIDCICFGALDCFCFGAIGCFRFVVLELCVIPYCGIHITLDKVVILPDLHSS